MKKLKKKLELNQYLQELDMIKATVGFNSSLILSPYSDSTALRHGDLLYRSISMLTDFNERLAEMYMINSKMIKYDICDPLGVTFYRMHGALIAQSMNHMLYSSKDKLIKLPKPLSVKKPIDEAILRRRSKRNFVNVPISLQMLSTILYYSQGITGRLPIIGISSKVFASLEIKLRATPSAGALYPIDLYVIALNVKDLKPGIYIYEPNEHALICMKGGIKKEEVLKCFVPSTITPLHIENVSVIIILVSNIWKTLRKYGNRGLKFIFIEAGQISENIHLIAQSLGCASVDVAAFYDREIEKLLNIDGISYFVILTILVGVST